jgi:hypothetical protein
MFEFVPFYGKNYEWLNLLNLFGFGIVDIVWDIGIWYFTS